MRSKRQDWNVGQTVKVGFLTLTVVSKELPSERTDKFLPCATILEDGKGRRYSFTPYSGLTKLD